MRMKNRTSRSQHRWSGRNSRGMTLIELVIAMVIVAVLASIAIPSYNAYVLKSHRTEAKTTLLDLTSMEERFFSTSNVYSTLPSDLGYGAAAAFPFNTISGYYQINVTPGAFSAATPPSALAPAGSPATYGFTATAIGVQANDTACATLSVSSNGTKTATGTDPNPNVDCWN
jgi:type IV pilus assembly protein PilE